VGNKIEPIKERVEVGKKMAKDIVGNVIKRRAKDLVT
jgi:hypothetical protein